MGIMTLQICYFAAVFKDGDLNVRYIEVTIFMISGCFIFLDQ